MLSVLISIYNKEQPSYLKEALTSLTKQTYKASEYVIVKDGPLNNSLEIIIQDFCNENPNVKVIPLKKNLGLGKALNIGLKYCSYNLIARMDTDDISKPNRFEEQIKVFEANPNIDVCSSWIEEFKGTPNNIISIKKLPENQQEIIKYAKYRCPINHPSVMYKKDAVIKAGGYEGFPEDYYLWIKMLMNGSCFYNIQKSLLFFRFNDDVIKRRGGLKYAINDIKAQLFFHKIKFIPFHTLLYNLIIRIIIRLVPSSIRLYFYKNLLRK